MSRDHDNSYTLEESEGVRDITAYEELWTAVIKRALEDAAGNNEAEKLDAESWLRGEHYKDLCSTLGLSHSYLLKASKLMHLV
jgi:hypothetical protein